MAETRENGGVIGKVLRGSLEADVEAKVFNAAAGDLLGPFPSADRRFYEIFVVNAKHPARLDEDTASRGAAAAARGLAAWRGRRNTSSKPVSAHGTAAGYPMMRKTGRRQLEQSLATFLASVEILSPSRRRARTPGRSRRKRASTPSATPSAAPASRRRPVRHQVRLGARIHRGGRQGNQHGGAQGAATFCRDRHAARLPARICRCARRPRPSCCSSRAARSRRSSRGNAAARDFVTSYVAISSAGGLVTRLFDLRGKVEQGRAGRVRAQRRRQARRAPARRS